MNIRHILCVVVGYQWRNTTTHPVHGFKNKPYADSYCSRCGRAAGAIWA